MNEKLKQKINDDIVTAYGHGIRKIDLLLHLMNKYNMHVKENIDYLIHEINEFYKG